MKGQYFIQDDADEEALEEEDEKRGRVGGQVNYWKQIYNYLPTLYSYLYSLLIKIDL